MRVIGASPPGSSAGLVYTCRVGAVHQHRLDLSRRTMRERLQKQRHCARDHRRRARRAAERRLAVARARFRGN